MDILELPWDVPRQSCLHVGHSRVNGHAGRVGLGSGCQKDGRLGQRQPCLRQPQLKGAVHAGLYDGHRLGIGQADVLTGRAEDAADGRDQVPRLQQPGQIMDRRIRV